MLEDGSIRESCCNTSWNYDYLEVGDTIDGPLIVEIWERLNSFYFDYEVIKISFFLLPLGWSKEACDLWDDYLSSLT